MGSSGCGCAKPRVAQSKCNAKPGTVETPCLMPVPDGCNTDLTIVQGEDLRSPICFSGRMSQIKCMNSDGSITLTESIGTNARKLRLACTGDEFSGLAGVYNVTALSADGKKATLDGFKPPGGLTKCFESVVRNVPGCQSTMARQTPPTVIEHIDASDWILEGSIYTRRGSTGSKRTFGAYVTSGSDTIYYTIDRKVFVGDAVCVYLPSGTVKAIVQRVVCDMTMDDCGNEIQATFLELDKIMPAVPDGSCVAISVDAGSLIDLDFELSPSGCIQVVLPWYKTKTLPYIKSCEGQTAKPYCGDEGSSFLGYWDVFATIPYLNAAGQLRTERKRVACGCVTINNSSDGLYENC
jgi:hypothetical protein